MQNNDAYQGARFTLKNNNNIGYFKVGYITNCVKAKNLAVLATLARYQNRY